MLGLVYRKPQLSMFLSLRKFGSFEKRHFLVLYGSSTCSCFRITDYWLHAQYVLIILMLCFYFSPREKKHLVFISSPEICSEVIDTIQSSSQYFMGVTHTHRPPPLNVLKGGRGGHHR